MVQIIRTTNSNKDFIFLTGELDTELTGNYGTLQKKYDTLNKIDPIDTAVVAYENRKPVGCGCFKVIDKNTVEVKRMYVLREMRGKGISKMILSELEKWAFEKNFKKVVLETGVRQNEAIGLYKKSGYVVTENYGPYIGMINSICMEKIL